MAIDLSSLVVGDDFMIDDERPLLPDIAGETPWEPGLVAATCRGSQETTYDEDTGMGCFELADGRIVTRIFTVVPDPV